MLNRKDGGNEIFASHDHSWRINMIKECDGHNTTLLLSDTSVDESNTQSNNDSSNDSV